MKRMEFRPLDSIYNTKTQKIYKAYFQRNLLRFDSYTTLHIDSAYILFAALCLCVFVFSAILYVETLRDTYSPNDSVYASLPSLCASGEWVNVNNYSHQEVEYYEGSLFFDGTYYYSENDRVKIAAPKNISLTFFEGKKIELEGHKDSDGVIQPIKVRCTGQETDEYLRELHQEIIVYIMEHVNDIHTSSGNIIINDIGFAKNDIAHIHVSDLDNEYIFVLKIVYHTQGFSHELLGQYKIMDDKIVRIFGDEFNRVHKNKIMYEYNKNLSKWEIVW